MLLYVAALCGCGSSAGDHLAEAREELATASWSAAIEAADAGLESDPDDVTRWGLELVKLEALARAGEGARAKLQLERITRLHPDHVPPTQFSATADQLRTAGAGPEAIEVLDMGLARHPGDRTLERMIGGASSSGESSPEELEMLRKLGYIQ
ncbi:MAG: hypothetical protein QNK04_01035 [Myxococcota bacterium]|nr:hypothetical protein [Myxococcota bacterium]